MEIEKVFGRQILDSRGIPTVEAEVWLRDGIFGRASVPSGASTGAHEAHELRDGGDTYFGQSVHKAVDNIHTEIFQTLRGVAADDQFLVDKKMIELDGTDNKSRLGANTILSVSLATMHAAAKARRIIPYKHINDIAGNPRQSIPVPMMNVLNGGKHANNSSDIQEFMIVPINKNSYSEIIRVSSEIFHSLKQVITENNQSTAVGDEGGFTYPVNSNSQMLDLLVQAIERAGYAPGTDVSIALDVAASELFEDGSYILKTEERRLSSDEMIGYLADLTKRYPITSIEDGLSEDEWDAWQKLTTELEGIQVVGDDLLVTNKQRLLKAIDIKAGNAILIKPNQIGTLTETVEAINLAKKNGWKTIVSHRSGETEDTTIAHLAIGTGAGQIKTGSLSRSERTAKHNEILRVEEIDGDLSVASPFDNL